MLHVVLHEPEIPNNTGSVGRSCVALGASLHLIHPMGFSVDEKACRRAGLDYWPRLSVAEHATFDAYLASQRPPRLWLFTTKRGGVAFDADFRPGDHLVFGKESAGLPASILDRYPDRCLRYPMRPGERSLNLSNVVCTALFDATRVLRDAGHLTIDADACVRPAGEAPQNI